MINKELVITLIEERSRLHPDDPRTSEYWSKLTDELSKNKTDVIDFLNNCTDTQIYWLSEIFEDISAIFKSSVFIECLKALQRKYPELDLESDIEYAEKAIKG